MSIAAFRMAGATTSRTSFAAGRLTECRSIAGQEYRSNVDKVIRFFSRHSAGNEVVITVMKNRPEWDMTALACANTANHFNPLDPEMNDDGLRYALEATPPTFVVVSRDQRRRIVWLLDELDQNPTVLIADLYSVREDANAAPLRNMNNSEILMSTIPEA